MPVELRKRLLEASRESDRSLNAEIVDRLQRSCRPSLARRAAAAALRTIPELEGEGFMKGRLRLTLAALSVLILAATTVFLAVASGPSTKTRPSAVITAGEMPTALASYLATSQGFESEEGPGSAGEAEFRERAYPDNTISVAEMNGARAAFAQTENRHSNKGREKNGEWTPVGPSTALYPADALRNSFLYVPNEYVAGGRTTSIAVSSQCKPNHCVAYITPAGGGVWRTKNALDAHPDWKYMGGPLGINAAGSVVIDENDPSDNTVYVGTGEANICGSGCVAGTGLYRSRNGGVTWTNLGRPEFQGKGIGAIVVKPGDPDTLYVGSTTALRGMSSSCCSGVTRPVPGIAKWGLYKSTDAGQTWSFIHNGSANAASCTGDLTEFSNPAPFTGCSPRGVRSVVLDPSNPDIVYASSYARGVWRSNDAGATWTQIKPSINPAIIQSRAAIAVTKLPNGNTRMYVHEGNNNNPNVPNATSNPNSSRLFRSDDVATGTPTFTDMSSADPAQPGFAFRGICDPQCWYDIFVYTPPGHPDMVYVGGDYFYGETTANKRGVVLSQDAGVSATDMTFDGTDMLHPNGIHPDQHSLVTIPGKPLQFIETGDGGVVRSSGELVDRSSWCDDPNRGLTGDRLNRCKQMLSAIPSKIDSLNDGLSTLQFQSLSVSPHDVNMLQGGTQDNGTWENKGSRTTWVNTMIGDGGQSGFDVGIPEFRMHNFTGPSPDVNFDNGELSKWIWTGGPLGGGVNRVSEFYSPVITDPVVSKTMFAGSGLTAYRTKTAGLGTRTIDQAHAVCNEWTGTGPFGSCGDWARLGPTPLTSAAWGDRGDPPVGPTIAMAAIERTPADTSTAWAATTSGRVFVSKNVDAEPASSVVWTRIDLPTTPGRYVTSIYIDPNDGNHAWVSYSGYDANTPSTPGHIFEVHFNGTTATWADLSHNWGDLPVTDLVRDDVTGDLYAASDFGVAMLPAGGTNWVLAAQGMPNVEVAGLTIVPSKRVLYAATHGLSAWKLNLDRK
jgi:hypothetical protein